jgi:hypothetical protein
MLHRGVKRAILTRVKYYKHLPVTLTTGFCFGPSSFCFKKILEFSFANFCNSAGVALIRFAEKKKKNISKENIKMKMLACFKSCY